MRKFRGSFYAVAAFAACSTSVRAQVSGTLETYFQSDRLSHGFVHVMSWGEINARVTPNLKATFSFTELPTRRMYDEGYVAVEGPVTLRAGRFRTQFGFSNWSELVYTGINHIPILKLQPLAPGLRLLRDDTGVDFTFDVSGIQFQAAAIDTQSSSYQIAPNRLRAGSLRAQAAVGRLIFGLDALRLFDGGRGVYGFDARFTAPRLMVKAEYMKGAGDGALASGYFIDAAYRIPKVSRTQAVARTEGLYRRAGGDYRLHTLGIRFIQSPNLTIVANYGWGQGAAPGFVASSGSLGWSLRTLFQLHF